MKTSETINEVAAAIAAAQKEFPVIDKARTAKIKGTTKDGSRYEYEYKYADIADILKAMLPILGKNGLAVMQATVIDTGAIFIGTRVAHSSGQWIESEYPVCSIQGDHQKMGAALTYARRYALCSILGIAADDDVDGEIASEPAAPKRERQAPMRRERITYQEIDENGSKPLPPTLPKKSLTKWAEDLMAKVPTLADLEAAWNDTIAPAVDDDAVSTSDSKAIAASYKLHQERLAK